ncbi:uncharacterized protein VDAG_02179 [Verticillium dahliae VdLs.17]|uniref:Uncharacterized protein n=1 Tax=Verticillium dahliae (strain VdLs.17 / ATCC MYA-4575 / FGSC 10137) TaxID=498257 RepID=G2WV38_VERDV|nr:uncharacterized protein VDAG_02179 [Verticillium dahliae VdLs.17]EGY20163.1 hypothetical protein VDAG_02179 [Verticillium dahliae VdLs.17]
MAATVGLEDDLEMECSKIATTFEEILGLITYSPTSNGLQSRYKDLEIRDRFRRPSGKFRPSSVIVGISQYVECQAALRSPRAGGRSEAKGYEKRIYKDCGGPSRLQRASIQMYFDPRPIFYVPSDLAEDLFTLL